MKPVTIQKEQRLIPTYVPKKPNDLPMFFENKPYQGASGRLYPLPYSDGITDEKTDKSYDVYTLENDYLKVDLLPEIGGKLLRGFDKVGNYDFIYHNEVVKPALVGLAGAWISGGIEFNWPQHHRPTTFMPLEAAVEEYADGSKTVWMGEVEPMNRMKGMVGITLEPGRSYIKAKVRLYNRTNLPQPFMWWANLAVPVNKDYRTVFPPDVEWVNDHDRRAVMSWPIAKGVYRTARPYDFGEGTDLTHYDAVKVPSSYLISQGQSDMDFIAGYDTGRQKGIATVANHFISPGKKMWHWGIGDFGDMWCSNLTDANGPYIELMTGVYTDNQPDFTWIAPYESREFEQIWFPIRDIGEIKNATNDAAVNLEFKDGKLILGLNVTGIFPNARVSVKRGNTEIYAETADFTPDKAYIKELSIPSDTAHANGAPLPSDPSPTTWTVSLTDEAGRTLIAYTPVERGRKQPISPRLPVERPEKIATVEELYLNGYHLEQYKQHNYKPEDYYLEGLRRDPGDARCNTSMARLSMKNARFEDCLDYADTAIRRLTIRNEHPTDTEALYLKGLALVALGRDREAYDILYRAAWNYTHRSAALFELACLDCKAGAFTAALTKLNESLGLNYGNEKARNLKTAILRRLSPVQAALFADENAKRDLLDLFALIENSHFTDNDAAIAAFDGKPEAFLDVAVDYLRAGFAEDAIFALSCCPGDYPLVDYYKAFITKDKLLVQTAEAMDTGTCFPNRAEDIAVLKYAIEVDPKAANACYYLGLLYYDRFRYEEAAKVWEEGVRRNPAHGKIWRNLALYYFDKAGEPQKAQDYMEKALEFKHDPRLLFEYQQLLKNRNVPPEERLAVYDRYPDLLAARDDCFLDRLTILSELKEYRTAIELAKAKRFHIYEGGEGKLTKWHAWVHVLAGNEAAKAGDFAEAERLYRAGTVIPKSYGEAKTFFNQEAHLYYFLGKMAEAQGTPVQESGAPGVGTAHSFYETAAVYKAAVSEISLFRALALRKLSRDAEAGAVLQEMLSAAEHLIVNKDLRTYYGVGSPSPMPFEYDIEKNNLVDGNVLKAFALLGLGKPEEAKEAINAARALSPYDFRVFAFDEIEEKV